MSNSPTVGGRGWRAQVAQRLRDSASGAVVLERFARGGGATRWFHCSTSADLSTVLDEFLPGSCVSFYFDQRIASRVYSEAVADELRSVLRETGEILIGQPDADGVHLVMEVVSGQQELNVLINVLGAKSIIFFGPFPGRDNDGEKAITALLPDADGVVRPHPH